MSDEPEFSNFEGSVSYVDQAMLDKLKRAMIDAFMRREFGYILDGSCDEGWFEYMNVGAVVYYHYKVSYPDGKWTDWDSGETVSDALTADVVSTVYEVIENNVDIALGRMMRGPRPDAFSSQISALQYVVQHLSISGEARLSGDGSATRIVVGDQLVPQYVAEIGNELADLDGYAMIRLRQVYGRDRIEDVMSGLHALATVTGVMAAGEQQVWARFHRDFHKLIETSTSDFAAFAVDNEVTAGEIFDVVQSIGDAAGVFSSGVTDAIGKVATVAGIVEGWLPDPPEPHDYTLDGGSWDSISSSFWTATEDLVRDVETTESAFVQTSNNAFDAATDFIAPSGEYQVLTSFDLKNPTDFLGSDGAGYYHDEYGTRVDVEVTDRALHRVAALYEAIGDHCTSIAARCAAAPSQGPWYREFAIDGDGYGHFSAFAGMATWIGSLLRNNAREMHSVGERCLVVLHDFNATDGAIEAQLNRETRDVVRRAKEDASP